MRYFITPQQQSELIRKTHSVLNSVQGLMVAYKNKISESDMELLNGARKHLMEAIENLEEMKLDHDALETKSEARQRRGVEPV